MERDCNEESGPGPKAKAAHARAKKALYWVCSANAALKSPKLSVVP